MAQVFVATLADADTARILDYLASNAGKAVAVRYNSQFETLYDRLANHPDSCPLRPELGPNIRIGLVPPYIVIYRHVEARDAVMILRIVHGRRKITGAVLGRMS